MVSNILGYWESVLLPRTSRETPQDMAMKKDWDRWDVKSALGKKGYSLVRVAKENGYVPDGLSMVFTRPWPKVERIIANILETPPENIWPSRYDSKGRPVRCNAWRKEAGSQSNATKRKDAPATANSNLDGGGAAK